jgi:hypothetical protein
VDLGVDIANVLGPHLNGGHLRPKVRTPAPLMPRSSDLDHPTDGSPSGALMLGPDWVV